MIDLGIYLIYAGVAGCLGLALLVPFLKRPVPVRVAQQAGDTPNKLTFAVTEVPHDGR